MSETAAPAAGVQKVRKDLDRAVIRFAGDSGDGMQLTGEQFTTESAWAGNDIATLPNFPAEIRAPAGTLFGVSSFQLQFGSQRVYTPGDRLDCLVAMNPAALKVHLRDLKTGGLLIVNTSAFDNIETIKQAIMIEAGVSLLPRHTVEKEAGIRTLVAVPFALPDLVRPVGIIHRRQKALSAAVSRFIQLLQEPATGHQPIAHRRIGVV